MLNKRKDDFIEAPGNSGKKMDSCPKEPIPTADQRTDFKGKLEGWAGRVTTGKTIALTRRTFVGKVMSLLFNLLSRLVITFL